MRGYEHLKSGRKCCTFTIISTELWHNGLTTTKKTWYHEIKIIFDTLEVYLQLTDMTHHHVM